MKINKKEKIKKKRLATGKTSTLLLIIADILVVFCLVLAYGPFSFFRDTYITMALGTMNHKYLAKVLYNDKIINKVLENNKTMEAGGTTDTSKIKIEEVKDTGVYESYYEEQILKKDNDNDLYKIVELDGGNYKGYMVVLYDPSKIDLVMANNLANGGQKLTQLAKSYNAKIATNASGFSIIGRRIIPASTTIVDGKIIEGKGDTIASLIGFTKENILLLTKTTPNKALSVGMEDAMAFGPFLIVNGVASTFKGNGGYGLAPRTAIGQRKDGIVLLVVIDGRQKNSLGIDMVELTNVFVKYKAYNAANLDGGGSSALVENGSLVNKPTGFGYTGERYVVNAFIVR